MNRMATCTSHENGSRCYTIHDRVVGGRGEGGGGRGVVGLGGQEVEDVAGDQRTGSHCHAMLDVTVQRSRHTNATLNAV